MKAMKLEDIKSRTKDAVDYLVQPLEFGHRDVLAQYLGATARFHTYSFSNVSSDRTILKDCQPWPSSDAYSRTTSRGWNRITVCRCGIQHTFRPAS